MLNLIQYFLSPNTFLDMKAVHKSSYLVFLTLFVTQNSLPLYIITWISPEDQKKTNVVSNEKLNKNQIS